MGLLKPVENKLTPEQNKLLAQLNAIRNFNLGGLNVPSPDFSVDSTAQISTFDYMKKITESTLGSAAMDIFLKTFIDKLFDPNSDKLERILLKSMAKSLDSNGKKISNTQTNQEWLLQNALPPLNAAFRIAKAQMVKSIITMIFGPKEKMSNDPVQQTFLLNSAICSSDMFSVSNPVSNSDGDLEFNKVELKKNLEKGQVVFVISCQDVKIKLPESVLAQADSVIANNSNPSKPAINPSIMFEQVTNVVSAEAQRINAPENASAVKKSFLQILVEKIINLLIITVQPFVGNTLHLINTTSPNGDTGLSVNDFCPSPCDVRGMCVGSDAEFKKKTTFVSAFMNALYAYLLSVILQRLIKELKKIIKNYILKKAQEAIKRKLGKRAFISDEALQKLEKAQKFAAATASLNDIFKFNENK